MHQQYLHNATSTLNYMSSSELQELFNDDEKLDEKIDETLKSLESEKDEIINENRRIAESNLEKEPKLIELRSTINELTTNGKELSEKVQSQLAELKSKSSSVNPENMLNILKAAAAESEEKSDKLIDEFLDKSLSLDDFLDKFKTERVEMHLRKLKAEKMQDLLRQGQQGGTNGVRYPPQQPPMGNFYSTPNSAPYPSMPGFPMPMPPSNYRPPY